MNEALEVLRASVNMPMSPEEWEVQLQDWEVFPVRKQGRLVGAIITRAQEIHCGGIEAGWLTRGPIRKTLGKILDTYGFALTAVRIENARGRDFVSRLGFRFTHMHEGVCFYRMQRNG